MRRLAVALAALLLLRADMYPDASNAKLPEAQENLKLGQISATALGFKNDGTTNNSAAMAGVFARTDSPTVYFPAGTYMLACPTGTITAASGVSLVGAAAGSTIIKFPAGCTIPADMFYWDAKSGVRVSQLTFDLNTPAPPSAGRSLFFLSAYGGAVNDGTFDHLRIVNGAASFYLITVGAAGGHTLQNFHIDDNYLHLTAPSYSPNQCIAATTVGGAGIITKISIDRNVCVNSAIQSDATHSSVSFNDVSGFGFGTGIFSPLPSSSHQTIIGNRIHDSAAAERDTSGIATGGIEVPHNSIVCDNMFWNLAGSAIINFGKNNLICNNTAWNNSNLSVSATPPPADDTKAAYYSPLLGGSQHGANSRWVGNRAWDDRATPKQLYGYLDYAGDAVPGISFSGNDLKGYGAGRAYAIGMGPNPDPNPVALDGAAVSTVANLPLCVAATKHSMASVFDQNGLPTYRGALTGGGSLAVLAYCNGTAWEAH